MEQLGNHKVGAWIKGKWKNGELFHGFIDSYEPFSRSVKVRVVKSDNEGLEGKTISVIESKIERLGTTITYSREAILNLIDVALLIKDENWFKELSLQLECVNEKEENKDSSFTIKKENEIKLEHKNQKGRR
ncbi:IDEAL domain-containing protein [Cytobacillus sp. S13-E01]|uniref:IDEAL domain-containing protein n=1 Tax=Cytobacillus sp. S13-E01 TaxID=3031326 RepID=UPI0023D7E4FF|nr:IDEAL domain-containing protein [Cytobacillus sp. S13-E01]MDF0727088.1 IDEAL domain-containing protein [Cytobacillus sp. S13-E01]